METKKPKIKYLGVAHREKPYPHRIDVYDIEGECTMEDLQRAKQMEQEEYGIGN